MSVGRRSCDIDCQNIDSMQALFEAKLTAITNEQKILFTQKDRNETMRAWVLALIFAPLIAWNGWLMTQTKHELSQLTTKIIDYQSFKAENKAALSLLERRVENLYEILATKK